MNDRPHPFTLVFGALAETRFPEIRDAVGRTPDVDHFLLAEAVVDLLQELRPDAGIGEAMDDFVAFAHAAFRFWAEGAVTRHCTVEATRALCADAPLPIATLPGTTQYIQLAPRLVWAQLAEGESHEPLDGWFVIPAEGTLRQVACFGVHAERPGLGVVVLDGPPPGRMERDDGTPLFAPTMEGGEVAGLHAVAAPEELLLLAWRAGRFAEER